MQKLNLSLFDLVEIGNLGDEFPWRVMYAYDASENLQYKGLAAETLATNANGWWIQKYRWSNGTLTQKAYWSNGTVKWSERSTLGWRF